MDKITGDGYYLFYWMASCHSELFDDLWEDEDYHHNRVLIWCYDTAWTGSSDDDPQREMWCLQKHYAYSSFSVQYIFDGPGDSIWYSGLEVYWIEYAFEDATGDDMQQYIEMSGHNYYF